MLKYLFRAQYNDGSEFKQNQEDVSAKDRQRSAFFDIDHERLTSFALEGGGDVFRVDLRTGQFEVNGTSFYMHDVDLPLSNFRVIFFRQHLHCVGGDGKQRSHAIRYLLGWQANMPDGENVQRVMVI